MLTNRVKKFLKSPGAFYGLNAFDGAFLFPEAGNEKAEEWPDLHSLFLCEAVGLKLLLQGLLEGRI